MPIRLPEYASSLTSHRLLLYGALSSAAVAAVISNALDRHNNFYSIAVYLSKSNGSVVVSSSAYNFSTVNVLNISGLGKLHRIPSTSLGTLIAEYILWSFAAHGS